MEMMLKRGLMGVFWALVLVVHAQVFEDQSGFISLDCGLTENSTSLTDIAYTGDATFIDTGVSASLSREYITNYSLPRHLWTARSFPEGVRNCYNLSAALVNGKKYLIRAIFAYGDYDKKNQLPKFDLHLGVELWETIQLENASAILTKEIIHVFRSNYMYICLVNTGGGTPFVSALEIRRLKDSMYETKSGSLATLIRADLGSGGPELRFPFDAYDRIWEPFDLPAWTYLTTKLEIDAELHNSLELPTLLMGTAATPRNPNASMDFRIELPADTNTLIHFYLHFAEIVKLKPNRTREFDVNLNGFPWITNFVPEYLSSFSVYNDEGESQLALEFSLNRTMKSNLPPLINAFEVYTVKRFSQSETDENDVNVMISMKSRYGVKRNWNGDPCSPKSYIWQGLDCSYNGATPPRIIYLDLSSSGLTGEIAPQISNLTFLQHLDLSNNSLTGPLPDFLARLASLRFLNLAKNKFFGSIPVELIERANNGTLSLSIDGYVPDTAKSCHSAPCERKRSSSLVPALVSAAVIFTLLTASFGFWCIRRSKRVENESFESKIRRFTYPEILRITNNMERVIGRGGFGIVYHGSLDDTQVAVKMLSEKSGYKELKTEAEILTRVHHKNLTSLVGYCLEGKKMGLVYEYMANGNVEEHLSCKSPSVLSWTERLQIATDAAQGLDYLHNGCKPPIIHRDVKSANILLNEELGAKIADFGISKFFPIDAGSSVITAVIGTVGYLDPEYFETRKLREKSDIYSFGVVLLELITGRSAVENDGERSVNITSWVKNCYAAGKDDDDVGNVVDPRLGRDYEVDSVKAAVELAMECVSRTSSSRPTMNLVAAKLEQCLAAEMARKEALVDKFKILVDSDLMV